MQSDRPQVVGVEGAPTHWDSSEVPSPNAAAPPSDGFLCVDEPDGPLGQAILQGTRLRMLAVLGSDEARRRGGYTLQDLGQILDCSPQNAHHHLRILDQFGAAHVVRAEATQRVPRQFWLTDVRGIQLEVPGVDSAVVLRFGAEDGGASLLASQIEAQARAEGVAGLAGRLGPVALHVLAALDSTDLEVLAAALARISKGADAAQ